MQCLTCVVSVCLHVSLISVCLDWSLINTVKHVTTSSSRFVEMMFGRHTSNSFSSFELYCVGGDVKHYSIQSNRAPFGR